MSEIVRTISLTTYDIMLGPVQETLKRYLSHQSYSKICILVDEHTRLSCLPLIAPDIKDAVIIEINSGEKNKTLDTCKLIWTEMAAAAMDRHSFLINLGGGVIGDMGGFVASCYMRGIDFIQIPTTLLSQVDASVGGKLAIDFLGYKNFIGLFQNPKAVLIDPTFLRTLPERELRSGFAEMIKHGLIQDRDIFLKYSDTKDWHRLKWQQEIYDSVLIKKNVVEEDPREADLRKILNFGHTIGHAIESISLSSPRPLLHGEAIGLGMIAETVLSHLKTGLKKESVTTIIRYIRRIYPDLDLSVFCNVTEILQLMRADKKNKKGNILMSLLNEIGECTYDISVTDLEIESCLTLAHEQAAQL